MDRLVSPVHSTLLYLVKAVHLSITFFVVFAWTCSHHQVLLAHIVLVPLLVLHWKTYHDRCVLSDIEAWLQGEDIAAQEDSPFIRGLLRLCTSQEFEKRRVAQITYGIMGMAFVLSLIRLVTI